MFSQIWWNGAALLSRSRGNFPYAVHSLSAYEQSLLFGSTKLLYIKLVLEEVKRESIYHFLLFPFPSILSLLKVTWPGVRETWAYTFCYAINNNNSVCITRYTIRKWSYTMRHVLILLFIAKILEFQAFPSCEWGSYIPKCTLYTEKVQV